MGHGFLASPKARNVLANSDYCPQCLAAGGPSVVGGSDKWPVGRHGMCGDPHTAPLPRPHENGGKYYTGEIAGTWTEGSDITLEVVLTAFHMGRFGFRICKIEGNSPEAEREQLTEECFNKHILLRANGTEGSTPNDPYYHLGGMVNSPYKMTYRLPEGLTCDGVNTRCVLQWYYLTGNSCNPPNEPPEFIVNPLLGVCGVVSAYPEEFWNCADVVIKPASGRPPYPSPPPAQPSPPATPLPPGPDPLPPQPYPCPIGDADCFCKLAGMTTWHADYYTKCEYYYDCYNTKAPTYRRCPDGKLFSNYNQYCEPPELNTQCANLVPMPQPPPASPGTYPPPPTSCTDPKDAACFCKMHGVPGEDRMYANKADGCKTYFWCYPGGSAFKSCPPNTIFSDVESVCDHPNNVKCGGPASSYALDPSPSKEDSSNDVAHSSPYTSHEAGTVPFTSHEAGTVPFTSHEAGEDPQSAPSSSSSPTKSSHHHKTPSPSAE